MALGKAAATAKKNVDSKKDQQLSIPQQELEVLNLDVSMIHPDPNQPRKNFEEEAFKTLVAQIAATNGCKQPIKVRPHPELMGEFMICFGERRWRSHRELNYPTIPAILEVTDNSLFSTRLEQVIENIGRDDLNRLEEAQSFKLLIDTANQEEGRAKKFTQKDLANLLGYKPPYLTQVMAILKTPESVQALSVDGITQNVNVFSTLNGLNKVMDEHEFAQLVEDVRNGVVNDKELQTLLSDLTKAAEEKNNKNNNSDDNGEGTGVNAGLNNDRTDNDNEDGETGGSDDSETTPPDYGFYDYKNQYDKALFDALIKHNLAFEITAEQKDEASENLKTVTLELEVENHKLADLLKLFVRKLEADSAIKTILNKRTLRKFFTDAIKQQAAIREELQDCNFLEMKTFEVVDGVILVTVEGLDKPLKLNADDVKAFSESL